MQDPKLVHCPALVTIKAISGKWKTRILWLLRERPHHFGELKLLMAGVSAKVLSEQLKQLANESLVVSQETKRGGIVYIIYDYSPYGRTLIPVLDSLGIWGITHEDRQGNEMKR